mgnify:CR=1 FL=1
MEKLLIYRERIFEIPHGERKTYSIRDEIPWRNCFILCIRGIVWIYRDLFTASFLSL